MDDWSRATVHGAIVIFPPSGSDYPFPKPYAEVPIIIGEWWKKDVMVVLKEFMASGGQPIVSNAFTINGQPGDLYPCSKQDTFKLDVVRGKTYLLRIINAVMNEILFFAVADHKLTVVGADASYTKQLTSDFVAISPGETLDCLLVADQQPGQYYMAARAYVNGKDVFFDHTTTTAIIKYDGSSLSPTPKMPRLPAYDDTDSATDFSGSLKSLASEDHPIDVPKEVDKNYEITVSISAFPCEKCTGPNGTRLGASLNNISFVNPSIDVLSAYYHGIGGVFGNDFPTNPPLVFDFTADVLPLEFQISERKTEVRVIEYGSVVEVVLQGTNLVVGMDHPMHLHGYSFYVVGWGFGNYDKNKDPRKYNLVDPPLRNTIAIPKKGWTAIRFKANNPGVWLMHCHIERHLSWGMNTIFIVKDGQSPEEKMLPPPEMPPC
ncbi:OLC1v1016677C1 [Oldenlandia corymbosa var. corymbosa]|uniref:Laccase n=1 Tax=Oldenlandia corymbosa var. corymbosa TaxID=529605 RepID=A0AAV1E7P5_OLDCO|nr:OLC1v1016677C1 [Oldenlandia corymbosa var. corymbosa]